MCFTPVNSFVEYSRAESGRLLCSTLKHRIRTRKRMVRPTCRHWCVLLRQWESLSKVLPCANVASCTPWHWTCSLTLPLHLIGGLAIASSANCKSEHFLRLIAGLCAHA